jgi:hypothetical protein
MRPGPVTPRAPVSSSRLMRLIAEGCEDERFQEMAAAIVAPGTKIMSARPAIVDMATRLRQGAPHSYLPLLASWKPPARRVFLMFEREGIEQGVQAETLPGDVIVLRHVRVCATGGLQQPSAWSMVDLDAQRPFVVVEELPCGPAGPAAEADRIWMSWFHSIVSPMRADNATILEEQRRRWFHWLLDDLAVVAVAFSDAVTSMPGQIDTDFRISPKE